MASRAVTLGVIVLMLLVCAASAGFSRDAVNGIYEGYPIVKVWLDGQQVAFDVPAISMNDRTLVPVRFVTEKMGAKVSWDEQTYTATITSKGILGAGAPTRGTPGKGALDSLTETQLTEGIAYGVGLQMLVFDIAFKGYISWDPTYDAWGVLYTEYSAVAIDAYDHTRKHEEVPTAKTVIPLPKGMMEAYIGFKNLWAGSLSRYRFYVRQGSKIVEARTFTLPSKVSGMEALETVWVLWYTDGMDLSMPVEVMVAKPDGSSYTLKWNLFELK